MSNLRKLKQSVDKFRSIGIAHDLTPKERQDIKNMVEEAKCEHVNTVMSNLRKLKQSVDKFRSIGIAYDLTPKERQDIKNMVEEAKCEHVANNADEPENYRFLVVGTGTRRRVIKIRKSN